MEKETDGWKIKYARPAKLDLRDRKILSILQQNARTTIQDIAKYLSISKAAVIYRINRLKAEKTITGFKTHYRLPLPPHKTALIQLKNNTKKHAAWMNALASQPGVITIMSLFGAHNTLVAYTYSNKKEHGSFVQWCKERGGKSITTNEIESFQLVPLDYTMEKVNIRDVIQKNTTTFQRDFDKTTMGESTLSPLDRQIMKLLHNDARTTITDLASATKAYKSTIKKRIQGLIASGWIVKFSASINPYAFQGTQFYVCWFTIKNKNDKKKLVDHIKKLWNGHGIATLTGKWNMIAFLHFNSNEEINAFEEYINSTLTSLQDYQIDLIREQVKLDWLSNDTNVAN